MSCLRTVFHQGRWEDMSSNTKGSSQGIPPCQPSQVGFTWRRELAAGGSSPALATVFWCLSFSSVMASLSLQSIVSYSQA